MSNRRKVRAARPFPLTRPGEEIEVAFIPGATINTAEAIAAMQKQTHDGLIEMLGRRRRSGVSWRHVHGRAEGERFLDDMYGDRPDLAWGTDQYRAFLAEHGDEAVLVVAKCEAVR
jgi:hypothetical protein